MAWKRRMARPLAALTVWGLGCGASGCARMMARPNAAGQGPNTPATSAGAPDKISAANPSGRSFSPPTELDRLLDSKPQAVPTVKPASAPALETAPGSKEGAAADGKGNAFTLQVDALSDMDAAQARKAKLERTLGEKIDVVFDPPYYKLRLGSFATKREAEDKLVELAGKNLQGFVVRQ